MKIALVLEYDGTAFSGWQAQAHAVSVQGCVETALARVADHPVRVQCAGRTDAGVHACAQVVHFETAANRADRAWMLGTNAHLSHDVCVWWAAPVDDDFNARFSATRRRYRYVLSNRATRVGLWRGRLAWECRPLDVAAMAAAARVLEGEHDFSSFRAAGCQSRHPIRTLHRVNITRRGDLVAFDLEANAFLQHMVRNIVGSLLEIGRGERPVGWLREVLDARDRSCAGMTAPPDGLYFTHVDYPTRFGLPGLAALQLPFA
jgi:tRNA pseudouridine38-40 synthase